MGTPTSSPCGMTGTERPITYRGDGLGFRERISAGGETHKAMDAYHLLLRVESQQTHKWILGPPSPILGTHNLMEPRKGKLTGRPISSSGVFLGKDNKGFILIKFKYCTTAPIRLTRPHPHPDMAGCAMGTGPAVLMPVLCF